MPRTSARLLLVAPAFLLASGCAFTQERIRIEYPQPSATASVAGADRIRVKVTVVDTRPAEAQTLVVSHKINGFGMQGAEISNEEPAPSLVARAVASELRARGYRVEDDAPVPLTLELTVFSHQFRTGFFAGESEAAVAFIATVRDAAGKEHFRETIHGPFKGSVQLASGANVKEAYEAALQAAARRLADSPAFQQALAAAAQPPAA